MILALFQETSAADSRHMGALAALYDMMVVALIAELLVDSCLC